VARIDTLAGPGELPLADQQATDPTAVIAIVSRPGSSRWLVQLPPGAWTERYHRAAQFQTPGGTCAPALSASQSPRIAYCEIDASPAERWL
jgi:hypothetical protein